MHPGWRWVGTYEIKMAALIGKRAILTILGTLRSDDCDGNKNVKQAVGLMNKTTTLHVHHTFSTFLCRPCATRTWGNEKIPNFMFCEGRKQLSNHKIYFFLSEFGESAYIWQNKRVGIRRDEDWKTANSLFKQRFPGRRRPCISRSLLLKNGGLWTVKSVFILNQYFYFYFCLIILNQFIFCLIPNLHTICEPIPLNSNSLFMIRTRYSLLVLYSILLYLFFVYTAISRKVVRKSARDNPERHCGWFWVHCSSKKFERIGTKGHENVFSSAKGKQQK